MTMSRPNILLVVTDEERQRIPHPAGFSLPSRERMAERGVSFDNYYAASASSSRSVL
jgi:arylsulfatase